MTTNVPHVANLTCSTYPESTIIFIMRCVGRLRPSGVYIMRCVGRLRPSGVYIMLCVGRLDRQEFISCAVLDGYDRQSLYHALYPEWPHRQCVGLAFRRSHDRGSLSAASLVICSPARIAVCNTWSSGATALCRVGGATSQFDLPSLTPLSVAGCG